MKFELITCDRCGVRLDEPYQRKEATIVRIEGTGIMSSYVGIKLILCKACNEGLDEIHRGLMVAKSKIQHEYIYGDNAKRYEWSLHMQERGKKDEESP